LSELDQQAPIGFNFLTKAHNKNNFIDLGLTSNFFISSNTDNFNQYNLIPGIGFRRVMKNSSLLRLSIAGISTQTSGFTPLIGISIGRLF
jgi:hypothetical protein